MNVEESTKKDTWKRKVKVNAGIVRRSVLLGGNLFIENGSYVWKDGLESEYKKIK